MELVLIGDDGRIAVVECRGQVSREGPGNPLETLLGTACYSRRVVLGLKETTYIDSSGIGWLVVSHRRFLKGGGRLVVHSVPPEISNALHFVQVHSFLTIAPTKAEAESLAASDTPSP